MAADLAPGDAERLCHGAGRRQTLARQGARQRLMCQIA